MTGVPMEFARRVIRPILDPVERLTDALADAARRERTALLVLAAYAAVWTLYGVIAKACQDMQIDAAEIMVWSSATSLTMTFQLIASAAMPAGSSNATATTMARFCRRRRLSDGLQIRRQMRFSCMPRATVLADGKD